MKSLIAASMAFAVASAVSAPAFAACATHDTTADASTQKPVVTAGTVATDQKG